MENARNRTAPHPKPKWWNDVTNDSWMDCISTATDNFGERSIVTGNKTFVKDYDKYGFRKLNKNEQPTLGDIITYYNEFNSPHHSVLLTKFDNNGNRLVSYGNGNGDYIKDAFDYYGVTPSETPAYFRFIGTPAERAEIAAHNAAVKKQQQEIYGNEKGEPQRIEAPTQAIPTEKVETLQFLDRIKKR